MYDEVDIDAGRGFVRILFVDEQEQASDIVKQIVSNVQSEGMVNFIGRVVSTSLEKSKERIAVSRSASLASLAAYASGSTGKIT